MKVYENGIVREMTPEEVKSVLPSAEEQIEELKRELSDTDYKAIKYAEGWISEEEYAPIRAERQAIRDKINELENNCFSDEVNLAEIDTVINAQYPTKTISEMETVE